MISAFLMRNGRSCSLAANSVCSTVAVLLHALNVSALRLQGPEHVGNHPVAAAQFFQEYIGPAETIGIDCSAPLSRAVARWRAGEGLCRRLTGCASAKIGGR